MDVEHRLIFDEKPWEMTNSFTINVKYGASCLKGDERTEFVFWRCYAVSLTGVLFILNFVEVETLKCFWLGTHWVFTVLQLVPLSCWQCFAGHAITFLWCWEQIAIQLGCKLEIAWKTVPSIIQALVTDLLSWDNKNSLVCWTCDPNRISFHASTWVIFNYLSRQCWLLVASQLIKWQKALVYSNSDWL